MATWRTRNDENARLNAACSNSESRIEAARFLPRQQCRDVPRIGSYLIDSTPLSTPMRPSINSTFPETSVFRCSPCKKYSSVLQSVSTRMIGKLCVTRSITSGFSWTGREKWFRVFGNGFFPAKITRKSKLNILF